MRYETKFYNALIQCLGEHANKFTIIKADRNGQEPNNPYILISMMPHEDIGQGEVFHVRKKGSNYQKINDLRRIPFRLTLQAYANDEVNDIFDWLYIGMNKSSQFSYYFHNQGLSITSVGNLIPISEPIDTDIYRRVSFDTYVEVIITSEFEIENITEVKYFGDINPYIIDYSIKVEDIKPPVIDHTNNIISDDSIKVDTDDSLTIEKEIISND